MPKVKPQTNKAPSKSPDPGGIIPLAELPDSGIKLCVYGKSGTGKTRFMSTFHKLGPLLHLICSSNGMNEARSIRGTPNIDCWELRDAEQIKEVRGLVESRGYKTVCLDHVTGFCDMVLASVMGIERLPEQKSFGMAKRDHYAQLGIQAKTYLRELMDLPCNVIITGQERAFDVEEDAGDVLMPFVSVAATPAVSGWIAPAVDYMCQTFKRNQIKIKKMGDREVKTTTDKKEFCLRVGPDPTFITKFRVPPGVELPDVVVDPSYDKISKLINGVD